MRRTGEIAVAVTVAVLLVGACSSGSDSSDGGSGSDGSGDGTSSAVLKVPAQYPTIQKAVDRAEPGDLVLVSPGTYEEAVTVETPNIVIRGLDRATTVLEGSFELDNGIRVVGAGGVAIENMTAQNYTANGFFWTGVKGYRGSYLTAIRNGDYGMYAFESTDGLIEHSYGAGSPDAGFYIGACFKCRSVIDDVVSEWNGLGYSGTNSGGDLYIVNSTFRNNRAGVVPNVGTYEPCFPQRDTTIVGNLVYSNNNPGTDAIDAAQLAFGNGILLAGAIGNTVERNQIWDHDITGIGVVPLPEDDPHAVSSKDLKACEEDPPASVLDVPEADLPATILWPSTDNHVVANAVSDSRLADIGVNMVGTTPTPDGGNCFSDNEAAIVSPTNLQQKAPCGSPASGDFDEGAFDVGPLIAREKPPTVSYKTAALPDPGPLANMPNAAKAKARPQRGAPAFPDVGAIVLPSRPQ
jgi:hypothetical protein